MGREVGDGGLALLLLLLLLMLLVAPLVLVRPLLLLLLVLLPPVGGEYAGADDVSVDSPLEDPELDCIAGSSQVASFPLWESDVLASEVR